MNLFSRENSLMKSIFSVVFERTIYSLFFIDLTRCTLRPKFEMAWIEGSYFFNTRICTLKQLNGHMLCINRICIYISRQ